MNLPRRGMLFLSLLYWTFQAFAQTSEHEISRDLFAQNLHGREVLMKCLENHGSLSQSGLQIALTVTTEEGKNRGQSYQALPPYQHFKVQSKFYIDRPNGIEFSRHNNPFPGFFFGNFSIVRNGTGRQYDLQTRTYTSCISAGFEHYRYFPQLYLKSTLDMADKIFYTGERVFRGERVKEVLVGGSRPTRLLIHAEQNVLLRVENLTTNHPYGNGIIIKEFDDYVATGLLTLPSKIVSGSRYAAWGALFNHYQLTIDDHTSFVVPDEEELQEYKPVVPNESAATKVVELGRSAFMVQNVTGQAVGSGYNVLFVEFPDFMLVSEAPVSNEISQKVIELIRKRFPDKAIRYLLQSHHHQDHIGGLREYIAHQATIITTPGNQQLFEAISQAEFNWAPDRQSEHPQKPTFMIVKDSVSLSRPGMEVQIFDIGPIPHAKEMLVLFIPSLGLLWQADMISYKEWDLESLPAKLLIAHIKKLKWPVRIIAGVHGQVLKGEALQNLLKE